MPKRTYALSTGAGLFVDDETEIKVLPGDEILIDEALAGQKTQIAIRNRHLVEVENPKKSSDIPEGMPGRDAFIAAGLTYKKVQGLKTDEQLLKVEGIDAETVKALKEWAKNNSN